MSDHEERITALQNARREIEEALIVMSHLETRYANVQKMQAQEIEELRRRDAENRKRDDAQRKLNEETDRRIAALVSPIGEFIRSNRPSA